MSTTTQKAKGASTAQPKTTLAKATRNAGRGKATSSPAKSRGSRSAAKPAAPATEKPILLGFDLGTNTSYLTAAAEGSAKPSFEHTLPTVVGYAEEGIVNDVLPGNGTTFFGEEALRHKLHLRLAYPLHDGIIADKRAARDFCAYLRELLDPARDTEVRAVIGLPAGTDHGSRETLRQAVTGAFDRVLLVPEPFLAALGFREEKRLGETGYIDPVSNSLFIDIGAGTTDLCLVQGYFPTAEDQLSLNKAGDFIDEGLEKAILRTYPDTGISMHKVREIKEKHSYVGDLRGGTEVKLIVGGKPRKLEMGPLVGEACNALLDAIFPSVQEMIARAPSDAIEDLLQNILITGGGSMIRGIDERLEAMLEADGYENPRVRCVGEGYKAFVAKGGLKAARGARADQWQHLVR